MSFESNKEEIYKGLLAIRALAIAFIFGFIASAIVQDFRLGIPILNNWLLYIGLFFLFVSIISHSRIKKLRSDINK